MARALLMAGDGSPAYVVIEPLFVFCMVVVSLSIIPTILFACSSRSGGEKKKNTKDDDCGYCGGDDGFT